MVELVDKRQSGGLYERNWERFRINRQGMLLSVGFDLALPKVRTCQIIDISQGGASFSVTTTIGLGPHYYLTVVGLMARVGCAEMYRNEHRVGVQFIKEIDEELLHQIVRADYFTGETTRKKEAPATYMRGVERPRLASQRN